MIALTRFHGDHIFGMPGLIKTMCVMGRTETLYNTGPEGWTGHPLLISAALVETLLKDSGDGGLQGAFVFWRGRLIAAPTEWDNCLTVVKREG